MTPRLPAAEEGAALILTMMVVLMLAAIGHGLMTLSDTEAALAHNHRAAAEVRYAADAALERALIEMAAVGNWTDVLTGSARSTVYPPSLQVSAPWGGPIDIAALTADVQADSDATAVWGSNNPAWRVFGAGSLEAAAGSLLPAAAAFLVVWVADDPSEMDNNPSADTNAVLQLRGIAVNVLGMRAGAQLSAQRTPGGIRVLAWRPAG